MSDNKDWHQLDDLGRFAYGTAEESLENCIWLSKQETHFGIDVKDKELYVVRLWLSI